MSRGKRYSSEPKLNIKKVIAVILFIIVMLMFIIAVRKLVKPEDSNNISSKTYFTLYSNDKWGVIDNNANTIIEPVYDEMIIIPNNKEDVFICTENVDYENGLYDVKVLNSKNKQILKQFNQIQVIENYDEYNNLWYEEVLKFEKNGKYGLIDLKGKVLVEAKYDSIDSIKGIKNSLITKIDNKVGVIDEEGNTVVPNEYNEVLSLGKDTNLYIIKDNENNYGIYGKIEPKYEEINPINNKNFYVVKQNGKYKVINEQENEVFTLSFDDVKEIKDNMLIYTNKGKYGAYNIESQKNISCEYDKLVYTCNNQLIAKKDNSYGIIDFDNNVKQKIEYAFIEFYEDSQIYELETKNNISGENIILNNNLEQIANGIINEINTSKSYIKLWDEEGYKYINLSGEEKNARDILINNKIFLVKENGKYGYIDKNGNTIVEPIYDDAKEQNEYGFAAVKKDGKWGSIDINGKITCETNVNLDENLVIDFIGKYHLGRDINLQYYTDK